MKRNPKTVNIVGIVVIFFRFSDINNAHILFLLCQPGTNYATLRAIRLGGVVPEADGFADTEG
jgi:hypothetical protein